MAQPAADPVAELLRVYSDAEHELLAALTREVARSLADPDVDAHRADYIARLRAAGARVVAGLEFGNRDRVRAVLAKATQTGRAVAAGQLARATGRRRGAYDEPVNLAGLDQLAAAVAERTSEAHRSILRTTPDVYRRVVARATVGVTLGTQTRRQAAQRAMWEFAQRGVTSFTDRAGRTWELSAYAEMATRTASARAAVDAQLDRLATGGNDLVIVSDHGGECGLCRPFENKVLSISGTATGRTSVAAARLAGLFHPSCRHSLSIYLEGITQPATGPGTGPDPEGEKARARQRGIERQIRAWKRQQTAALDEPSRRRAAAKVRAWQGEMRAHLDQHPTLKRLSYRESPGAGNLPNAATYRDNPSGPFPDRELRLNEMSGDDLDDAMQAAIGDDDFSRFDKLSAESVRREEAARRRDTSRRNQQERAQARRARGDAERLAAYERLLEGGADDEEAVAQVYGISIEQQRRRAAIVELRAAGLRGRGFDELSREDFRHRINADYRAAEDATNGYLLNNAARRAGVDAKSLFTGPESRARRHASDELRAWWDIHGRPTLAEHRAELLGDTGAAGRLRAGRGDFLT